MTFKPLLAALASESDIDKLVFPLMWSPKLDGIRTMIHLDLGPVSRKLKLIPNEQLREVLSHPDLRGFDGEMVYGPVTDKDVFNRTQSAVMTVAGPSPYDKMLGSYLVFDDFTNPDLPFHQRFETVKRRVERLPHKLQQIVRIVPHTLVDNVDDLMNIERILVEKNYEGVMLRSPDGRYKFGRSTFRDQILMKIKRFSDEEATIVGFEELYHNNNVAEKDALGRTKRSSHAENLVAGETLGALIVKCKKFEEQFKIGTGFTAQQRDDMWSIREALIDKVACFKYQPSGMKDVPRFPSFKGMRKD